jgi:hypothetical protein
MDPAATFFYISVGISFWVIATVILVIGLYIVGTLRSLTKFIQDIHNIKNVVTTPLFKIISALISAKSDRR